MILGTVKQEVQHLLLLFNKRLQFFCVLLARLPPHSAVTLPHFAINDLLLSSRLQLIHITILPARSKNLVASHPPDTAADDHQ